MIKFTMINSTIKNNGKKSIKGDYIDGKGTWQCECGHKWNQHNVNPECPKCKEGGE